MRLAVLLLAASGLLTTSALASSSAWHEAEGARVRLVTTGLPDAEGMLRAALEIDLAQGWKTYWRDPGDAGVPPSFDVSATAGLSATLGFPPPERIDDGTIQWAGYEHPVTLPVTLRIEPGRSAPIVTADVFLGLCETICIPMQARLELDPDSDPENIDDAIAVQAAFDRLPSAATPEFGLTPLPGGGDEMLFEAHFPGGEADLFVVTPLGYVLGTPERRDADGKVVFAIPVVIHPKALSTTGSLSYTLVTSAGSVEGSVALPK